MAAVDLVINNAEGVGFHSAVEFLLTYASGTTDIVRFGWDGETFLGDRILFGFAPTSRLSVLTRVAGSSAVPGGGAGPGLFPVPVPVPEPATLPLCASGLGLVFGAWRRTRRLGSRGLAASGPPPARAAPVY